MEAFEEGGVTSEAGSLRQLRLYGRMFKNRCSYMIYSKSFKSLPPVVRTKTLEELWRALHSDDEKFEHLGSRERKRIITIVRDTVNDLPTVWQMAAANE